MYTQYWKAKTWQNPVLAALADITACPGTDTCNLGISQQHGYQQSIIRSDR